MVEATHEAGMVHLVAVGPTQEAGKGNLALVVVVEAPSQEVDEANVDRVEAPMEVVGEDERVVEPADLMEVDGLEVAQDTLEVVDPKAADLQVDDGALVDDVDVLAGEALEHGGHYPMLMLLQARKHLAVLVVHLLAVELHKGNWATDRLKVVQELHVGVPHSSVVIGCDSFCFPVLVPELSLPLRLNNYPNMIGSTTVCLACRQNHAH